VNGSKVNVSHPHGRDDKNLQGTHPRALNKRKMLNIRLSTKQMVD
jgi:hypothetical protein